MNVDFHTAGDSAGRVFHGKIRYVGPSVRRQSRDAVVEAVFDNDGHDLRPGMFVTARLALGEQMRCRRCPRPRCAPTGPCATSSST